MASLASDTGTAKKALDYFSSHRTDFLEDLKELVRIPSVSFPGFPASEVKRSAEAVATQMRRYGLENVEVISMKGAHPYIYADWLHAPGKPTILLYAHHDVQPVGNEARWDSAPFEPTERDGRLFARGAADDKAGISVHVAAVASFLKTSGRLPLNVKLIIEGEEEIGSTNLAAFMQTYKEKLKADAMVLTDTANFDTGIPSLTVSLRGIVAVEVEVAALEHSVHSGLWGGPIADPAMGLAKMLASLTDSEGRMAIEGLWDDVQRPTEAERRALAELPYDERDFRKQASLLDGVPLRPGRDGKVEVWLQNWREPSVAINALEVSERKKAANIIAASAWAKVGIRIVPHMDAVKTMKLLTEHLIKHTPWGLKTTVHGDEPGRSWSTTPQGPAFEAAYRALELGYGRKAVCTGSGGSIPFVEPLSDALGGIPALLMGVEDPYTGAHSENESLHLGDWEKAIKSAIWFYELYGASRG